MDIVTENLVVSQGLYKFYKRCQIYLFFWLNLEENILFIKQIKKTIQNK